MLNAAAVAVVISVAAVDGSGAGDQPGLLAQLVALDPMDAMSRTSPLGATADVDVLPPGLERFAFVDDGVLRVVERGPVPGRDDARVPGRFLDPLTGRSAPVTIGASVVVTLENGDEPPEGTQLVKVLFASLHMALVKSTRVDEDAVMLAERLSKRGTRVYPNLAFHQKALSVDVPPNDPRYPGQFYLDEVGIEDGWAVTTGSPDVTVLIADNGCDLHHPDLEAKMDPGFDPFENDGDPSFVPNEDGNEHGTACAGIVAAVTDNNVDIAGTCPECRLRCARLLPANNEPVTIDSDVLTYGFAFEQDVDVVSNSWGFVDAIPCPTPLHDAIVQVQQHGRGEKGAVVVFASGNDDRVVGDDELLAVPGILGVGAVNNLGELTQFSNGGNSVDVVAPTGTLTTDISGADGLDATDVTDHFGGTSSACPIVSGVAGLLLSAEPDLTADEVNDRITSSAKQSVFATPDAAGHDTFYGFGLVQPGKALAHDVVKPPPTPEPTGCGCTANDTTPGADGAALGVVLSALASLRRSSRRSCAASSRSASAA